MVVEQKGIILYQLNAVKLRKLNLWLFYVKKISL